MSNRARPSQSGGRWSGGRGGAFVRRYERKFEVGVGSAAFLREEIGRHLPLYEYHPGFPYTHVTTVYYDTLDRSFYRQAERSYDNNTKIRVKEYTHRQRDGAYISLPYCFVELKQRRDGTVYKRRLPLPRKDVNRLLRGEDVRDRIAGLNGVEPAGDEMRKQLAEAYRELRSYVARFRVLASSIIGYRRTVYQESEEELRVTFDDRIAVYDAYPGIYENGESLHPDSLGRPVRRYDQVILEIKCPSCEYPPWLETVLRHQFSKQLSKFTTSIRYLTGRVPEDAEEAPPEPGPAGQDDTSFANEPIEN